MGFKKKMLSVVASATLVATSFTGVVAFDPQKAQAALQETKKFRVSNFQEVMSLALSSKKTQELIVIGNGKVDATAQLEKLGAKVKMNHKNYAYLADVPTSKVLEIVNLDSVRTVGKNSIVQLEKIQDEELQVAGQNEVASDGVVTPDQAETHAPTGVLDFHKQYTGANTRIAVIDSGPDPGHESFTSALDKATRKYGASKIVGVRDYTISVTNGPEVVEGVNGPKYKAEGDVYFSSELAAGDSITVGNVTYNTTGLDATDHKLYFGTTSFETNPYPIGHADYTNQDLNADGKTGNNVKNSSGGFKQSDNFPVLLVGDKVFVDTDLDNDFTDETAYANGETGTFDVDVNDTKAGANFRVTDLSVDGKFVTLFTDFNGHGSHVSGITAANGKLVANQYGAVAGEGVAPGAELVGLRVFKAQGGASTWSIQSAMIDAALPESLGGFGADVANLSLGSLPDLNDGLGSYGELMKALSEETDIIFVTSAGNNGPGVDTVGSPGDGTPNISVGAYINSEMWAKEYNSYPYGKNADGTPVAGEGLWYFSSVGPNEAGNQKPDIVGPGSAFAAHPVQNGPYVVMQGTSMSSPYVAGAVALLKSAAKQDRVPFSYEIAREALIQTAKHLDGYNRTQEGGGLIDIPAAYEYLKKNFIPEVKELDVTVYHGEKVSGGPGLYVRNKDLPETVEVLVENNTDEDKNVSVSATEDWVTPSVDKLVLPAGSSKTIKVKYDASKLKTGTNAATLLFDDASTPYVEARSYQTVIVGEEFTINNNFRFSKTDEVIGSQTKGYTFKVEPGASEVRFSLSALSVGGDYKGRVRMLVFDPDGKQVNQFVGYAGYGGLNVEDAVFKGPKPGVWEVHVYAATAPTPGKEMNKYKLDAIVQDVVAQPGQIKLGKVANSTELEKEVTFHNYLSEKRDVKLATAAFSGPKETAGRYNVGNEQSFTVPLTIKNNVSFNAKISNPGNPSDDLDLTLYDKDMNVVGENWDGGSEEQISFTSLPDGEYYLDVFGYSVPDGNTSFDLSYAVEKVLDPGEKGVGSIVVDDVQKTLAVGQSVTTKVSIKTPDEAGKYTGAVYLLDAKTNEVLSLLPISTDQNVLSSVEGANRIATGIEVSKQLHPDGYAEEDKDKAVILTTGYNFPDALSAGPLAAALNAPILSVGADGKLTKEVLDEITRLGADQVYILGGTAAVSEEAVAQLKELGISLENVKRLETEGMPNRYGTNLAIVAELQKLGFAGNGVFLATGANFADALSAASVAGAYEMPIVLTDGKTLSDEAKAILEDEEVFVLGGTDVISNEVYKGADKVALHVERLAGETRFGTLAKILNKFSTNTNNLYVASGRNFPDALSAAPLVVANGGLLLLVEPTAVPTEVDSFLTRFVYTNKVTSVTVLGGKDAVSEEARAALQAKVTK
ncbi:cell wall-binding repeat-containing protein [Bacillus sp. 1P10SD]|uniref:cell wall-binding repeat-containing protein n=1 Tax=Bacillus sp. 1P10SD TaxID=3132265 RepID=UPI0039A5C99C